MNASIFFKSRRRPIHLDQVERVVLNALEPTAPAAWSFLRYQTLEKPASGNSVVLRTRRSTLAAVYV